MKNDFHTNGLDEAELLDNLEIKEVVNLDLYGTFHTSNPNIFGVSAVSI